MNLIGFESHDIYTLDDYSLVNNYFFLLFIWPSQDVKFLSTLLIRNFWE